jgi:hypothetical protein
MAKEKDDVLTAGGDKSVDEKINETGADTPVVEKPKAEPKTVEPKPEPKPEPAVKEVPVSTEELLAAVRYLAGRVSSNAEMAELRQAFPRVFK